MRAMGLSTALTDPAAQLVADTSTIINLIATGSAADIIAALPNRIAVVEGALCRPNWNWGARAGVGHAIG